MTSGRGGNDFVWRGVTGAGVGEGVVGAAGVGDESHCEQREIEDRRKEKPPCVFVRTRLSEADSKGDETRGEERGENGEGKARIAEVNEREAERNQEKAVDDRKNRDGTAGRFGDGEHFVAALGVIEAVHPGKCEEVGNLPGEEDSAKDPCAGGK